MKNWLAWVAGISVSIGAHIALAGFLLLGSAPDPLEADPQPSGKISMEAYEVSETRAEEQENRGEETKTTEAEAENLNQGAVRSERARPIQAQTQTAIAQEPDALKPPAIEPPSNVVAPVESQDIVVAATQASGAETPALFAQGAVVAASSLQSDKASAVIAQTQAVQSLQVSQPAQQSVAAKSATLVAALAPAPPAIKAAQVESIALTTANAPAETLAPTAPRAGPVAASPILGENTGQIAPDAPLAEASAPPANPVSQTDAANAAQQIARAEPQTESLLAVTSFAGNGGAPFDPVSLAAVASFMRPGNAADNAASARDGISQLLSQIPCARVAATFIPETGELELRGHVPEGAMRGPIVDAIQAQLGGSIPVSGSMLVLPEPQCNVLDSLEDIGLPQSVDQENDALQVGASTQLVTLEYGEGQIVEIPIRGSEFASYVYLDFFQVDGTVFHMLPNQYTPLELMQPDAERKIGDDPDGITLIVQPPFGMELVVAYSSSEPLYEGVRDIVEPAELYLAFLQERIAELRAENEDYKGEWVYMFVQTYAVSN